MPRMAYLSNKIDALSDEAGEQYHFVPQVRPVQSYMTILLAQGWLLQSRPLIEAGSSANESPCQARAFPDADHGMYRSVHEAVSP